MCHLTNFDHLADVAGANSGAQEAWFGHNVWPLRLELSLVLQQFEECGIFEVRGVRAHFLFVFALKNAWMMCQPQLGYLLDLSIVGATKPNCH